MPQNQQQVLPVALDPNVYATGVVQIMTDGENFYLTLISGNQGRRFQFSPSHAKRLMQLLQKQMSAYESTYGEVEVTISQTVPSQEPAQTTDNQIGFHAQL